MIILDKIRNFFIDNNISNESPYVQKLKTICKNHKIETIVVSSEDISELFGHLYDIKFRRTEPNNIVRLNNTKTIILHSEIVPKGNVQFYKDHQIIDRPIPLNYFDKYMQFKVFW